MRCLLAALLALCVLAAGCGGGSQSGGVGITGDDPRPAAVVGEAAERPNEELGVAVVAEEDPDTWGTGSWVDVREHPVWYDLEVDVDEDGDVAVVPGSVTMRNCMIRGLVQNRSSRFTAGYVTVNVYYNEDDAIRGGFVGEGSPSAVELSDRTAFWHHGSNPVYLEERPSQPRRGVWEWPLAIPPGEIAPFEIIADDCDSGRREVFLRVTGGMLDKVQAGLAESVRADIVPHPYGSSRGYGYPQVHEFSGNFSRDANLHPLSTFYPHILLYDERMYEDPEWDLIQNDYSEGMIHKDIFVEGFLSYLLHDNDFSFPAIQYNQIDTFRNLQNVPAGLRAHCRESDTYGSDYDFELAVYQAVVNNNGGVVDVKRLKGFGDYKYHRFLLTDPVHSGDICLSEDRPDRIATRGSRASFVPFSDVLASTEVAAAGETSYRMRLWGGEAYFPTSPYRIPFYPLLQGWPYGRAVFTIYVENWHIAELADAAEPAVEQDNGNTSSPQTNRDLTDCGSSGPLLATQASQQIGVPYWSVRHERYDSLNGHTGEVLGEGVEDRAWLMGYLGILDGADLTENDDRLAVLAETVTVQDGVVRGLVRNLSATKYARDITVRIDPVAGADQVLQWRWPLTVQPGESIPFELDGWHRELAVDEIPFAVSGEFTDCTDLSRAFEMRYNLRGYADTLQYSAWAYNPRYGYAYRSGFEDYFSTLKINLTDIVHRFPEWAVPADYLEQERIDFYDIYASLQTPDSHPQLQDQINNLAIDDLQAHVAFFDSDGRVIGVERLNPYTATAYHPDGSRDYAPSNSIPNANPEHPNSLRVLVASSEGYPRTSNRFQVWIGGANG